MEDNLKHLSLKGKNALEYMLTDRNPKKDRKTPYIDYIDKNLNHSQKIAIEQLLELKKHDKSAILKPKTCNFKQNLLPLTIQNNTECYTNKNICK